MSTRLLIDDRLGNVYELPHGKIEIKHARKSRAGSLEFEYFNKDEFQIKNGQIVRLEKDSSTVFYGYVFKVAKEKITCYDQLRYLKFKDTKVFINKKATEITQTIAKENGMKVGNIVDTKYVIPSQVSDDKEWLDMITEALETTLLATGRLYFLQDNVGQLELLDVADTILDIVIDGYGRLTDYDYSEDIDSDTYNRIKLAKDNKETGKREIYLYQDSSNIARWGKLQYYEVVDEGLNEAKINEKGQSLLELKNREKKTFSLKNAVGDIRCKAGYSVYISIPEEKIEGLYLIDSDAHKFEDEEHLMDLELVVY
ncbi:MAG: hypothetical protein AB7V16_08845 [Vulcanibacillus sp.]